MSDWQKARIIFCSVSNNEENNHFHCCNGYRTLLAINAMPIKQYVYLRCFKQFYEALFFTLHAQNLREKAQHAYTIRWYTCAADALCRQCIKVRAHEKYMQSKTNKFCMQYYKPRYVSITDKNTRDFAEEWIFYRQSLIGHSFANCTVFV